ncbi:DndE family protein [Flaviaesturariibacter aridisoli]|uniref:DUF1832 domain-containing protein n=1 Tax=Flaviaesturariibacter aridisoli TaxID=2545761 RepID=A0A4V2WN44_9BACT|nr:DndE family protein [Flaviaesturariibacter aridisoli]TCZ74062.1 DUF1832 domain-containing protein [Flaviaesturariibacter aridisoli]
MAFKTTKENQVTIRTLTDKFAFKNEAAIARIAINYTLQLDKKFDAKEFEDLDSDGKEYRVETLAGTTVNPTIFKSLFSQHYGRLLSENEFNRLLKLHLNFGLNKIYSDLTDKSRGKFSHIDYLISIIKNGLNFVSDSSTYLGPPTTHSINVTEFQGKVSLNIGRDQKGNNVLLELNNLDHFDSRHIAVAGMIGSGKTQFVLDLLYQFRNQSANALNFIYIDYKGEGHSDRLQKFLSAAACEYVDISAGAFDFNPLSYISMSNERTRNFNIRSFVDAVAAIDANITIKRKNILTSVISKCFDSAKDGLHPTLFDVFEELKAYYEEREMDPDTLFAVVEQLSIDVFKPKVVSGAKKLYNKSLYLNLPSAVSDTLRQLCVFAILNYLNTEFTSSNDVEPDENRIVPIRYVIAIDEAHVYLKNKNASKVLENMLRLIRSKGVVVILLTQGVEDYKQKNFDFSSQIKIPVCLNIRNKDYGLIEHFLGTPKTKSSLEKAIQNLEQGKGLINIKEPLLLEPSQFWRTISK